MHTSEQQHLSERAASPTEVRISTLVGDRLCIACGYNLVGQPIVREPHYDMLIVRCPECATVASVQEYPLLGRWASRWAAVLAALWLIALAAVWMGSAGALFGFAVGSAEVSTETYSDLIHQRFSAWQIEQQNAAAIGSTKPANPQSTIVTVPRGQVVVRMNTADFSAWWQQQDRGQMLRDAGGIFSGVNWLLWYIWMWLSIVAFILGVVWAVLLFARGRTHLVLWGVVIILTAAALGAIPMLDWLGREPTWTRQAAAQQIAPLVLGLTLVWALLPLTIGLVVGRSVARVLVRAMLPPRMRSSLAFLWLTDGLEPPRPT